MSCRRCVVLAEAGQRAEDARSRHASPEMGVGCQGEDGSTPKVSLSCVQPQAFLLVRVQHCWSRGVAVLTPGSGCGGGAARGSGCVCLRQGRAVERRWGAREGEPCSRARRKELCVERLLLPGQVWVLWQLPASVPNIVKSSESSGPTPVSQRLP